MNVWYISRLLPCCSCQRSCIKQPRKATQGKPFAASNPSQSSSTAVKTFINHTYMRIPMLHISSAAGPVSLLVRESSVTVQTETCTTEAPKHIPRVNVKSSQYINEKKKTTTHQHLSPANGGNNQLALTSSTKPRFDSVYATACRLWDFSTCI